MNNISSKTPVSIAYQGIEGSFSYLAMKEFFRLKNKSEESATYGQSSFKDIFYALRDGKTEYAIVPVENSLAGSVYEIYDLLLDFDCCISGEHYHKVSHNLLGYAEDVSQIEKVFSHPKAIEQCEKFFEQFHNIEKIAYSDTARAAKFVADSKNTKLAAIASKEAAELYDLKVIKEHLEDNPHNYTRFLILTRNELCEAQPDKCSLIFSLPHTPQSLFKALEQISDSKINISKIQSRPIHGKPFEYVFYIDFEFNNQDFEFVKSQIEKFKQKVNFFKNLGYYQKANL